MQWDYSVWYLDEIESDSEYILFRRLGSEEWADLKTLGDQGWELTAVDNRRYIFKRPRK